MEKKVNNITLSEKYEDFVNRLTNSIGNKLQKVISYEENWKYMEYTEGYAFRESYFENKMVEIISDELFKKVFYCVYSAYYTANSLENFIYLLSKFLSRLCNKYYKKNYWDTFTSIRPDIEDIVKIKFFYWVDFNDNLNSNNKPTLDTTLVLEIYKLIKEYIK